MKKFALLVLAGLLTVAFTAPAPAMEYEFGGYWRTRGYRNWNFTGYDFPSTEQNRNPDKNITWIDTRTRLYFTAVVNDNLKFVNKFEMDAVWGNDSSYGDIGADGKNFEIKNSYADFTVGCVNTKVGVQGGKLGRGFLFDDDFAGLRLSYEGESVSLPLTWMRAFDIDDSIKSRDVNYFAFSPSVRAGNSLTINPFGMYVFSNNASGWEPTEKYDNMEMFYAGLNLDADMGPLSIWATGIYQGGSADLRADTSMSEDFKAWLGAAGMGVNVGVADLHGQFFYATGQDPEDEDNTKFWVPKGQSYYWSEIMGLGIFDAQASDGSPGDKIGNIMAANLGTTIKPTERLEIALDGWYAKLAEEVTEGAEEGEDELGVEANLRLTYTLIKGLKLDLVGAYLWAGEAIYKGTDEADPYEVGTRLSMSF